MAKKNKTTTGVTVISEPVPVTLPSAEVTRKAWPVGLIAAAALLAFLLLGSPADALRKLKK